ncbi:pantoate--beta-alanine ligase [Mesorhizobium sp. M2D.F.Ca.ET.185.01.1.1]|uniref:pantoate--beta-alanine ligase n=1 Tax=unclassified Mesorhizobium TaxID=325217 RepID=UPI000FCA9152|nr:MULTISPECIES: pantoate--beta-alanine ligase [unclassified Mesorhizobium]TGP73725.1 pantoate--beta-alanine ligase [bacterium M00.F.Ca.ET.227.01.1.1]TGP86449.1 pantoate--beta-alanine ligase [bacterium M00.F.Ca.ET.221.01.1.1]TGP86660.1 pantoate--beta-alanine ligase [bacterium M00.F.Ca.ET.222.01.1.1]TGU04601.1 pantoate--beta-alanine ligase [bacterium M00.F.Ca.ET.163.01.1.1]TGU18417.1 pantoate--beta-alanine ligase [bacterium M00.F.Ca.ET.156.01.1.1]TGU43282.1 pantoate--beta-alanine ligase [bacte
MTAPIVVDSVAALRAQVRDWRQAGLKVAMVPTMGALHDGHISLVRIALERADRSVVSIFVNPTQFAPTEDLDKYPRQLARDLDRLRDAGAHLAFTPGVAEMYPAGFTTKISVGGPSSGLETDFRPNFFDGVATVVAKLFLQAEPDCAVFGEKDYQQLCVVRQLCRDLDLPVEIVGAPTVRDAHGLAMSSRNAYLGEAELDIARQLNVILRRAAAALSAGEDEAGATEDAAKALVSAGFRKVDYVAARASVTLAPWQRKRDGRVLAAAWLGTTRLIDNVEIPST